jgi:diadenosine tetraphosphate (Ap4A) HIT family hydrolase
MAPVICKLKYINKNTKSMSKNKSGSPSGYLNYIATRPNSFNPFEINNIDDLEFETDSYIEFLNQSKSQERSALFGDSNSQPNLRDEMTKLDEHIKKSNANVWTLIISLDENQARELNYYDPNEWKKLMNDKNVAKKIGESIGIEYSNLNYLCAVHMEKEHPHLHMVLYEKKIRKKTPMISGKKLKELKKNVCLGILEDKMEELRETKEILKKAILESDIEENPFNVVKKESERLIKNKENERKRSDITDIKKTVFTLPLKLINKLSKDFLEIYSGRDESKIFALTDFISKLPNILDPIDEINAIQENNKYLKNIKHNDLKLKIKKTIELCIDNMSYDSFRINNKKAKNAFRQLSQQSDVEIKNVDDVKKIEKVLLSFLGTHKEREIIGLLNKFNIDKLLKKKMRKRLKKKMNHKNNLENYISQEEWNELFKGEKIEYIFELKNKKAISMNLMGNVCNELNQEFYRLNKFIERRDFEERERERRSEEINEVSVPKKDGGLV